MNWHNRLKVEGKNYNETFNINSKDIFWIPKWSTIWYLILCHSSVLMNWLGSQNSFTLSFEMIYGFWWRRLVILLMLKRRSHFSVMNSKNICKNWSFIIICERRTETFWMLSDLNIVFWIYEDLISSAK